jgi:hypothetical protein
MEPEGSLPYSKELATCPYSEPDQSITCPSTPLLEDLKTEIELNWKRCGT